MSQTKPLPKPRKSNKKSVHSVASSAEQLSVSAKDEDKSSESFAPHTLVPVSMVRSALFGVGVSGETSNDRVIVVDKRLGAEVKYSGPYLNQDHFKVWQACVYMARTTGGMNGEKFVVSNFADLLRLCGSDPGDTPRYKKMWGLLRDLQKANVEIETGRVSYVGSLILEATKDKESGKLVIHLSSNLAQFMSNETLSNDMLRLAGLGRDQLAAWLHNYYASQKDPPPLTVAEIQKLSGTKLDMPRLRQRLKKALNKLQGGIRPLIVKWRITKETDVVHVVKNSTIVDMRTPSAVAEVANKKRKEEKKLAEKGIVSIGGRRHFRGADGKPLPAM